MSRNELAPLPTKSGPSGSLGQPDAQSLTEPGSKSSNARNRTGCLTCKRRKKKCDETKPVCKNCLRTSYVCEGYPPVRHFRGEDEGEQEQGDLQSVSSRTEQPSSGNHDNFTAVTTAASEDARYLRKRVQQLEIELATLRSERARPAPRLPSVRSLVGSENVRRFTQPCPTCGQLTQLPNKENELNHATESPVLTAHSPSSRSTGSEIDTWSGNTSTPSAPTLSTGSASATSFGGHAMLQRESGIQREFCSILHPGGAFPVVLPSLSNQSPHVACYECRSSSLPCNGAAPCDQCRRRSFPECSYQVMR